MYKITIKSKYSETANDYNGFEDYADALRFYSNECTSWAAVACIGEGSVVITLAHVYDGVLKTFTMNCSEF